jgi:hypothetical protein
MSRCMRVLYFANTCSNPKILGLMRAGVIGAIATPRQGNNIDDLPVWCADNGCFSKGYPGDVEYLRWLAKMQYMVGECVFATAPDIVGDAKATLVRSAPFLPVIQALGYPAALVAQDGLEYLDVPFSTFNALFIGGTTEWKLGGAVRELVTEARALGKWVHMGRVNSYKRLEYAQRIGCDSADGTFLRFAPDINVARVLNWLAKLEGVT